MSLLNEIPEAKEQQTDAGKRIFEKLAKLLKSRGVLSESSVPGLERISHTIGTLVDIQHIYEPKTFDFSLDQENVQDIKDDFKYVPTLTIEDLENMGIIDVEKKYLITVKELFPHEENYKTFQDKRDSED